MMGVKIALIPGDGIGVEVTQACSKLLASVDRIYGINIKMEVFDLGAERYLKTGELLPCGVLNHLETFDAILLGAVGDPRVQAGIIEQGLLLKLRFHFDQYVNLRPIKLLENNLSPLKNKGTEEINFTVIRENSEGIYTGIGGALKRGTPAEVAVQEMVATYKGVQRILKYAFMYAEKHGRQPKLTICDKSNVLTHAHGLWQRIFNDLAGTYPHIQTDHYLIDAITMKMVRNPEVFDIIVTCNMFGDIITDLGAELQGGMGLAASANINPDGLSMFEPVHGSAPDIAGKNIANPLAAIQATGMMFSHLGFSEPAFDIENAVKEALTTNNVTPDLGGVLGTDEVGDYIVETIKGKTS